jgi:hypothetical protein
MKAALWTAILTTSYSNHPNQAKQDPRATHQGNNAENKRTRGRFFHGNLSSAIRLFVLNFYREQLLDPLDIRDKRAIQRLISATRRTPS